MGLSRKYFVILISLILIIGLTVQIKNIKSESSKDYYWKDVRTISAHTHDIFCLSHSPDNKFLASCSMQDQECKIWDTSTWQNIQTLTFGKGISTLAWSPDSKKLVCLSSITINITIWSTTTWEIIKELRHNTHTYAASWSSNGTYLAVGAQIYGAGGFGVIIWNTTTWEIARTLEGHTSQIEYVSWSPDGNLLVSGEYNDTVFVWNTTTWGKIYSYSSGHGESNKGDAWHPNGTQFASSVKLEDGRHGIIVWNASNWQEIKTLEWRSYNSIKDVAWSPDGSVLVAGATGIQIWDTNNWKNTQTSAESYFVSCISWNQNSSQFVTGMMKVGPPDEGSITIWEKTESKIENNNGVGGFIPSFDISLIVIATSISVSSIVIKRMFTR